VCCQGGDRTPAFRVTAGRLTARLPGTGTATARRPAPRPSRHGLAGTTRTCGLRLRRAALSPLSYGELVLLLGFSRVDGRSRTCILRLRTPASSSVRPRRQAPPAGLAPATSGLTGRRFHWLSYGGRVRALGLEPSLVRGKSPVPYQSGVTRIGGPGRNRTSCVGKTAGLRPAAPHGASDPCGARRAGPDVTMPVQLSRNRRSGWMPDTEQAREESNLLPLVLETAASTTGSSPSERAPQGRAAWERRRRETQRNS
jgi:hypothetical protein